MEFNGLPAVQGRGIQSQTPGGEVEPLLACRQFCRSATDQVLPDVFQALANGFECLHCGYSRTSGIGSKPLRMTASAAMPSFPDLYASAREEMRASRDADNS